LERDKKEQFMESCSLQLQVAVLAKDVFASWLKQRNLPQICQRFFPVSLPFICGAIMFLASFSLSSP
jgi:hypothetical protein